MRRVAPVAGRDLPDRVEMLGGSTTTIVTSTTSSNVLPAADRHAFRLSNASRICACRIRGSSLARCGRARPERLAWRADRSRRARKRQPAREPPSARRPSSDAKRVFPNRCPSKRSPDRAAPAPRRPGAPPHGRASPFPGNGDLDHSATHISRRAPVTPPVTPHASASSRRHRRRTPIRPRRPAGPRTASEPCYPVRACCARVACTAL
ncbi:hypothetical protein Y030_1065 [Burkholderia pseudomallei MSHR332]|nr:hypothetical protein Y030_1065 [Burkholderia pseudomallei MSHR332]